MSILKHTLYLWMYVDHLTFWASLLWMLLIVIYVNNRYKKKIFIKLLLCQFTFQWFFYMNIWYGGEGCEPCNIIIIIIKSIHKWILIMDKVIGKLSFVTQNLINVQWIQTSTQPRLKSFISRSYRNCTRNVYEIVLEHLKYIWILNTPSLKSKSFLHLSKSIRP